MALHRVLIIAGFLFCVGLMSAALYFQYGLGLEPCPLCIFQRLAVIALGAVLLLAALHNPQAWGRRVYAGLVILFAGMGAAVAGRHLWLQHLPASEVPACGPALDYMLQMFPLSKTLAMVFQGSGECAKSEWLWLGLTMPGWTLIAFSGFIIFGLWLMFLPTKYKPASYL